MDYDAWCGVNYNFTGNNRISAGVVNGMDLKSIGLCPRRFKSYLIRPERHEVHSEEKNAAGSRCVKWRITIYNTVFVIVRQILVLPL